MRGGFVPEVAMMLMTVRTRTQDPWHNYTYLTVLTDDECGTKQ